MIYTVGNMVGSLFTGPICDHFGRRAGMIAGSAIIMIGAAFQTAAQTDAWMIGGRFVLGFGVSIGTSSAPTYALELAPPQWRARVVGYYNTCKASIELMTTQFHMLTTDKQSSILAPFSPQVSATPHRKTLPSYLSVSHWVFN